MDVKVEPEENDETEDVASVVSAVMNDIVARVDGGDQDHAGSSGDSASVANVQPASDEEDYDIYERAKLRKNRKRPSDVVAESSSSRTTSSTRKRERKKRLPVETEEEDEADKEYRPDDSEDERPKKKKRQSVKRKDKVWNDLNWGEIPPDKYRSDDSEDERPGKKKERQSVKRKDLNWGELPPDKILMGLRYDIDRTYTIQDTDMVRRDCCLADIELRIGKSVSLKWEGKIYRAVIIGFGPDEDTVNELMDRHHWIENGNDPDAFDEHYAELLRNLKEEEEENRKKEMEDEKKNKEEEEKSDAASASSTMDMPQLSVYGDNDMAEVDEPLMDPTDTGAADVQEADELMESEEEKKKREEAERIHRAYKEMKAREEREKREKEERKKEEKKREEMEKKKLIKQRREEEKARKEREMEEKKEKKKQEMKEKKRREAEENWRSRETERGDDVRRAAVSAGGGADVAAHERDASGSPQSSTTSLSPTFRIPKKNKKAEDTVVDVKKEPDTVVEKKKDTVVEKKKKTVVKKEIKMDEEKVETKERTTIAKSAAKTTVAGRKTPKQSGVAKRQSRQLEQKAIKVETKDPSPTATPVYSRPAPDPRLVLLEGRIRDLVSIVEHTSLLMGADRVVATQAIEEGKAALRRDDEAAVAHYEAVLVDLRDNSPTEQFPDRPRIRRDVASIRYVPAAAADVAKRGAAANSILAQYIKTEPKEVADQSQQQQQKDDRTPVDAVPQKGVAHDAGASSLADEIAAPSPAPREVITLDDDDEVKKEPVDAVEALNGIAAKLQDLSGHPGLQTLQQQMQRLVAQQVQQITHSDRSRSQSLAEPRLRSKERGAVARTSWAMPSTPSSPPFAVPSLPPLKAPLFPAKGPAASPYISSYAAPSISPSFTASPQREERNVFKMPTAPSSSSMDAAAARHRAVLGCSPPLPVPPGPHSGHLGARQPMGMTNGNNFGPREIIAPPSSSSTPLAVPPHVQFLQQYLQPTVSIGASGNVPRPVPPPVIPAHLRGLIHTATTSSSPTLFAASSVRRVRLPSDVAANSQPVQPHLVARRDPRLMLSSRFSAQNSGMPWRYSDTQANSQQPPLGQHHHQPPRPAQHGQQQHGRHPPLNNWTGW